jgi:3-hydroxyisobutyrate dehydrogenase-like beta-hydroxyacid dehydrogenase
MPETIGFVGLGAMGSVMAGRLLEAGYRLRVWNRTIAKAEPLLRAGATAAGSPAEAAVRGGIVISMVADDAALEDVTFGEAGLLASFGERGLHVSMSTIAPATARHLAQAHAARGAAYLAAPVFGRPEAAAAGKLWVLASGAAAARERARPLLEAMGQQVFEFGEDPGAANVVKLAGNFLLIAAIEAMAEAYTFGEKNGIDREAMASLFGSTLFACGVYQNYGRAVAAQKPRAGGFRLALALKDVNLALGTAGESAVPMPLASLLHDRLLSAKAKGGGDLDVSRLALEVSESAGLTRNA